MTATGRTGVLGGTFDPVHYGHLDLARAAGQALALNHVLLVPGRIPPHRTLAPQVSVYHRFAMVALATLTDDRLLASDLELDQDGPSYTAATLRRLLEAGHDPRQLFFLIGSDAFAEITTWKDYPALLDLCHFAVIARPGHPIEALSQRLAELAGKMQWLESGAVPQGGTLGTGGVGATSIFLIRAATADVSSTDLRQRRKMRQSLDGLVPPDVDRYIRRHGLYHAPGPLVRDTDD